MTVSIKRLSTGDEAILEFLALHDADFDLDERGAPQQMLKPEKARRFLEHPDVLMMEGI